MRMVQGFIKMLMAVLEAKKAEDWLFRLCESSPTQGGLEALGDGFYRHLSAHPDSILAGGGLPREEVEAGWKEFRRQCGR